MEVMIEIDRISRYYGDRVAVKDLSFKVKKGSIHGFLGPNGAGKTTTMKMIAALLPPHSGRVLLDGVDVASNPLEIKRKIGILLETPPLFLDMETREYLEFAARLRGVPKAKTRGYVDEAIEMLGLESVEKRLLGNLSKGFKQKVGVAQAIAHKPEVVILDEPTSGLDPKAVIEMRALIKELKKERTILFSSHQLKEADLICDDVTIISNGKLMASASIEEIGKTLANKTMIEALVRRVSEDSLEKIQLMEGIQSAVVADEGDCRRIKIFSDSLEDQRESISEMIVSQNMGLLELTQERPDLEKIFLEVTKEAIVTKEERT